MLFHELIQFQGFFHFAADPFTNSRHLFKTISLPERSTDYYQIVFHRHLNRLRPAEVTNIYK